MARRVAEWRRRFGGAGVTCGQTFDGQVGANADDGHSSDTGNFNATRVDAYQGHWNPNHNFDAWYRIMNITIPQGATIEAAYISVNAQNSGNDGAGVSILIHMDDIDDAVAPTTQGEHAALNRTAASTAWDDIDFTVDVEVDSPSIVDAVQEIVDRGSWSSGNAMQVLVDNNGTTGNMGYNWWARDGSAAKAVKLHVQYCA